MELLSLEVFERVDVAHRDTVYWAILEEGGWLD